MVTIGATKPLRFLKQFNLLKKFNVSDLKSLIDKKNAVDIKDATFKYFNSEENIFEDLNLTIPKGKHIVITGPNGSGKSTLLGLFSGVFYPQSGSIKKMLFS